MKKFFIVANAWRFIEAILLITLGIFTIIFANSTDFKWVIGLIAAISLIIDGTFNLIYYFFRVMFHEAKAGLISSVGEITIGIFIIVASSANKTFFVDNFVLLVSLLLIVVGSTLIIEATAKIVAKTATVVALVVEYSLGALGIALGILGLVFMTSDVLLIIAGAVLIAAGIVLTLFVVLSLITAVRAGKTVREFFESDNSIKK